MATSQSGPGGLPRRPLSIRQLLEDAVAIHSMERALGTCYLRAKMTIKNLNIVQVVFNAIFKKIALLVVRYPLLFTVGPLLMTVGLCVSFLKFRFEDDPEFLFTMTYGRARSDRLNINNLFPLRDLENYDYGRETRIISGYGRILVTAKDEGSIFRPEVRAEIEELDKMIEKFFITHENVPYDYQAICSRYFKKCLSQSVINAFNEVEKSVNHTVKFKYPLYLSPDKLKFHFYGMFFGGVSLDDEGHMVDAKLAHLVYFLDTKTEERKEISIKWEKEFLNIMTAAHNFSHIKFDYLTSHSLPEEFVKAGNKAIPIFFVTASFMVVFSMVACMLDDCTKSKPWIGLLGCLSSLMGVLSGCGICVLFNISFPPSNYAVPFIMVGIGIDDTFIFLASWRNTDPRKSLEERIVDTYVHSGVAITVTSLTNVISFGACVITYIPGLEMFGEYAAASCIFAYVYQISFIGGCLVYLARIEVANYNGNFLICKAVPESQAREYLLLGIY
ncbi:daf-6 [Cordylochernes scorpioides]|uniref:Daf-6 n=1 Tax=Cordylochernes scorpioides TaxID=51811 RepID=A0ABY6KK62_9ARAC|nr:daf-6 [Cordylochernes scorpioides]